MSASNRTRMTYRACGNKTAVLFFLLCFLASSQLTSAFAGGPGEGKGGWGTSSKGAGAGGDGPTASAKADVGGQKQGGERAPTRAPTATTPDEKIEAAMEGFSPPLREATRLYQKLLGWDHHLSQMSPSQRSSFKALRPGDFDKAKEAKDELERLIRDNPDDVVSRAHLHNVCQKLIWDALADGHYQAAAAARDGRVKLPEKYQRRVDRACRMIAEALLPAEETKKRCLEVGCGCGSLVPSLLAAGIRPAQIHGVDISPDMIRNARNLYGGGPSGPTFEAADFINEYNNKMDDDDGLFDAVIFSSSLHNMPDMEAALGRARSLLRGGGRIVVLHPQGASEILLQVRSDPVLVRRPMPTAAELRAMAGPLELLVEPAEPDSPQEAEHGYLAVLQVKSK